MTTQFVEMVVEPVDMNDMIIDGQFNSASVHENDILLTLDGTPDAMLTIERVKDLRDVLDRALEFHHAYFATEIEGERQQ